MHIIAKKILKYEIPSINVGIASKGIIQTIKVRNKIDLFDANLYMKLILLPGRVGAKRIGTLNWQSHSISLVSTFIERPKPGPLFRGTRVSVLDLYQIKGGLRLYLLLDLDY